MLQYAQPMPGVFQISLDLYISYRYYLKSIFLKIFLIVMAPNSLNIPKKIVLIYLTNKISNLFPVKLIYFSNLFPVKLINLATWDNPVNRSCWD